MRTRILLLSIGFGVAACGPELPTLVVGDIVLSLPAGSAEPNLSVRGDRVWLSWLQYRSDGTHAFQAAQRRRDEWSDPVTIAEGDAFFANWADFPSVVELDDGTVVGHWLEKSGPGTYAYGVQARLSHDGGVTWSPSFIPHSDRSLTEHGFVTMLPLSTGDVAMVWLDGQAMADGEGDGPMQIRFTTVTPEGVVAPDVLIDDRTCECCQTDLVATRRGLLAAYRNRSPEEIRDIAVARFEEGIWSAPTLVANEGWHMPACPVNGPALAASGDTVAVAWFTGARDTIRTNVAFSTDGGESFGSPVRFDDGFPVGRVDVVLIDDAALVVWVENVLTGAEVRARAVGFDGTRGSSVLVTQTSEARASGFPRVVRLGEEILLAWTAPGEPSQVHVATARLNR